MPANLENTAVTTGLEKSVFILFPKKGNVKESSNCCIIVLISHVSKVMLKIFQARFQQFVNWELPDVQVGIRKGRGARHKIAICWIIEKGREFQKKHLLLLYWPHQSPWLWVTTNWKILKEMGVPDHLTCLWEIWYAKVKKQQLESDMELTR